MVLTNNPIMLENDQLEKLVYRLNETLANYQLYYQNLRGLHWNIKGKFFFGLHEKFEEFYKEAAENIDDIAERILTIGGVPLHSYEDYLDIAEIKAVKNVEDPETAIETIISNNQKLLAGLREVLKLSSEIEDEGTVTLTSDMIKSIEKRLWMLNATLR